MIRVGFILTDSGNDWVGGINYMSNLLHAIAKIPERQIEPVLIVPPDMPEELLAVFPPWQVLRTALAVGQHAGWRLARILGRELVGRDVLMERFLRQHGIDVLSHSGHLGRWATVPTIGWIPDFQHRRMPEFFQPAELTSRDRVFRRITERCTTVLLSSVDAQHDLARFDPSAVPRSRVLHFVSGFAGGATPVVAEHVLRERYDIVGPYFHLPSQFWAHKNHRAVIDALAILQARGRPAEVVCTGDKTDRRWPGFFSELMAHAEAQGAKDCFRVLGLVPYADMASLMTYSVAVINPSLFEGWSTTVEETKSLGLTMVLSDIPVHKEQNPEQGVYFDPHKPASLADALENVQNRFTNNAATKHKLQAQEKLPSRFSKFGARYQAIVLETILGNSEKVSVDALLG